DRPELLRDALQTLGQFRTVDGLYRTWLAPRERFECIDATSGRDANPPDLAIQMHVLVLLAEADPPAARALGEALQKRSGDEDLWVYYGGAPLLPMLRAADMDKAGCRLSLPRSLLQTAVPEQELWVEAIRLLQQIENTEPVRKPNPDAV